MATVAVESMCERPNWMAPNGAAVFGTPVAPRLVAGILAQSGGFFLYMIKGQPNRTSIGTTVTTVGAILLTFAIAVLVYGLFTAH
jgi:hypothetical protein